jgi:hypothetical protein
MNRNNINDIAALRKQRKQIKALLTIIVGAFAIILLIIVVLNIRAIVAPLEGIGLRIIGRTPVEGSFPVRLPGSADSIFPVGESEGFVLLSSTYIYTYTADGGQQSSRRHGYPQPLATVGGNRVLVYDQNGRRFSVFNSNGMIFEHESDERIIYASLGNTGHSAVVYRSEVHTNILSIYGGGGEWRFTKRFSGENVMQVAFTANDGDIIITSIGFDAGSIVTTVRRFDTSSTDQDGVWSTTLSQSTENANLQPVALHISGNSVFVLCNGVLFVLDAHSGQIVGSYRFRGTIIDHAFSNTHAVLLLDDYTAGSINMILLDRAARLADLREVAAGASQAEFTGDSTVALLEPGAIAIFGASNRSFDLEEDFTRFVVLRGEILLLGYNSVEQLIIT